MVGKEKEKKKKIGIFLMGYDMYITYGPSKFRGLSNLGVSSHCLNNLKDKDSPAWLPWKKFMTLALEKVLALFNHSQPNTILFLFLFFLGM